MNGKIKPGDIPWNKGLKNWRKNYRHSEETKQRIRASHLARTAIRISPINELQRKSKAYKAWRSAVFERDNFTCQHCSARSKAGARIVLHADHIKSFSKHPELRFDIANGRTLCVPCHKKTPTYGNGSKLEAA